MRYGFVLPRGNAKTAAEFAQQAELAGWDGFFVWEGIWGVDPWVALGAAAMRTSRIRLGTMITPIARRRPWKLASETATLDNLSDGRVILSVGLGAPDTGYAEFGEVIDRRQRAELTDEGLEILTGLWKGQPFSYNGKHYQVRPTSFQLPDPPVQQPRIPVWVVGAWPFEKSMQRVLRYDGLLPNRMDPQTRQHVPVQPEDMRQMREWIEARRVQSTPFGYVAEGATPGDDPLKARSVVEPWANAGATWWIEAMWENGDPDSVLRRIRQGPPRI